MFIFKKKHYLGVLYHIVFFIKSNLLRKELLKQAEKETCRIY